MPDDLLNVTGGCHCGQVRYRASGVRPTVSECHCTQCRKQAGHRYATTGARTSDIDIENAGHITWYRASPDADRGFCATCGAHLFWRSTSEDKSAILAASVDEPNGLRMFRHIFVGDKPGYYEIDDGLPQFDGYDRPREV